MSLRRAVIQRIKTLVPLLDGRVYQAFLAPAGVQAPYVTVKMAGVRGAVNLAIAGDQSIEVRIYRGQDNFIMLDALKQMVVEALNGAAIVDVESSEQYWIKWTPFGAGDFIDEDRRLISSLVTFESAVVFEGR